MYETQTSMAIWAYSTFGPVTSRMAIAARANEEMAELLRALSKDDKNPKAIEEAADVVIVLSRLFHEAAVDMWEEVERKMAINRARVWRKDGDGHGYHVREKA
jgi:NTP pyrophosphatase (non-canonical NTP hydrolase)